jgi:type IV pilus assembly protein PilE
MNHDCTDTALPTKKKESGFTLIEVMITVAIVAILVAVALPNYRNYIIRGKLVAGTNALAALRAQMEQYYQDNRTYLSVDGTTTAITSPCPAGTTADTFTLTCPAPPLTATSYTLTATGSGITGGAVYTVNQLNVQTTVGLPSSWGSVPSNNQCWIMRKGDSC